MNKLLLCIAAAFAVVVQSCQKTDDLWDGIESLRERVTALETQVGDVNRNIVALHRLMDASTVIVGVEKTETGYVLSLSDGTELPVFLGLQVGARVPILGIDEDGYWIYSVDNGVTFQRLKVGGEPVSAYPTLEGEHTPGATGITPQLRVDADGYWELCLDGVTWEPLLQNGERVNALGDNVPVEYSGFFSSISYNAASGVLSIELLTGVKFTLAVEDSFALTIASTPPEVFLLGETRQFEVEQRGVKEALLKAPAGWKAVLDETTLTVTAPSVTTADEVEAEITVLVTSSESYIKSAKLRVKLLNRELDADACLAWRNFKAGSGEPGLLDYSYAGYKHGEEAPADGFGLGYTVYNVCDYGADPTGATSSRAAFVALLDRLNMTGSKTNQNARAVIYFPAGRYILHNDDDNQTNSSATNQTELDSKGNNVSTAILIRGGNFVIKGDGRDRTTLVMDTPNLPARPAEMWSSPVMINITHYSGLSDITSVTADAPRGSFAVEVGSAAGISAGDWVCLSLSCSDPECVAQELHPHTIEGNMTDIQTVTVEDYHQVASVSGNRVTFVEPIMHAVEARWGWKVRKYPHYENVGVEDLAFEGRSKENFTHHGSWQDDGAYKPLQMMRLTNSWIRRVDFRGVSEALSIVSSANCSAYDIGISGNRGHSAVRSQSSSRVFIGKVVDRSHGQAVSPPYTSTGYFENAGQYHASGVSNTSMGAVLWNNTWGDDALFESHSKQPRATLVDRCKGGFVQWRFGGDETNVPNHLGDLTIWNMNATRVAHEFGAEPFKWWLSNSKWWKNMPPIIVGFHGAAVTFDESPEQIDYLESNGTPVEPYSLYEAQLRERLGYVPAWLNSLK